MQWKNKNNCWECIVTLNYLCLKPIFIIGDEDRNEQSAERAETILKRGIK